MTGAQIDRLWRSVRYREARERERAFRRALKHAGYLPRSIDLAVEKHRDWIEGKR